MRSHSDIISFRMFAINANPLKKDHNATCIYLIPHKFDVDRMSYCMYLTVAMCYLCAYHVQCSRELVRSFDVASDTPILMRFV